jgi:hypothetical protein
LGKIGVVDFRVGYEEITMANPLTSKVIVELRGGGPQDGERFELVESELEIGHSPYIEFSLAEDTEKKVQVKDFVHIYASAKPFLEGDNDVVLEYAGWFNGLYDPFSELVEE